MAGAKFCLQEEHHHVWSIGAAEMSEKEVKGTAFWCEFTVICVLLSRSDESIIRMLADYSRGV